VDVAEVQPAVQLPAPGRAPAQRGGHPRAGPHPRGSATPAELLPRLGSPLAADITFLTCDKGGREGVSGSGPGGRGEQQARASKSRALTTAHRCIVLGDSFRFPVRNTRSSFTTPSGPRPNPDVRTPSRVTGRRSPQPCLVTSRSRTTTGAPEQPSDAATSIRT